MDAEAIKQAIHAALDERDGLDRERHRNDHDWVYERRQREQLRALMAATGHPLTQELDTDLIRGLVSADLGVEKSKDPQYPDKNTGKRWSPGIEFVGNTEPSKVGASSRNVVRPLPGAKNATPQPAGVPPVPSIAEIEEDFDVDA